MCCLGQISHQLGVAAIDSDLVEPVELIPDFICDDVDNYTTSPAPDVYVEIDALRDQFPLIDKLKILATIFVDEDGVIARTNTELALDAMVINDASTLTRVNRERQLCKLFKKYGHEIKFINQYTEARVDGLSVLFSVLL